MIANPDLPRTLILDAPDRPLRFSGPLDVWQSHCRVCATGGVTIRPAKGYTGALISSALRDETEVGEDGLITNVVIDHIWLNGDNQSLGIKLKHIQLSTIHDIHVRDTDGPGLWLSNFCIESLFSNIVLSDRCGNDELPALLLRPESHETIPGKWDQGNITANSVRFAGVMIHFADNACLEVGIGPADVTINRRQREIEFSGCFFHSHARRTRPVVTVEEAYAINFLGTQMMGWANTGAIMQLGSKQARFPTGLVHISNCDFYSKPGSDCVGIVCENVEQDGVACMLAHGNTFGGFDARLKTAVDWGSQPGKCAAWGSNAIKVAGRPFIGVPPVDADILPFASTE